MQEHATVNETGATRMLSKTIDVDGLKVWRHTWPRHLDIEIDDVPAL
jgi:hypothetical protein